MAKKQTCQKTKATVIMIRIPELNVRRGTATLTIQRGDLAHIHEFEYVSLSLKHTIAAAVETALLKIAALEQNPPPDNATPTDDTVADSPTPITDVESDDEVVCQSPTDTDDSLQTDPSDAASVSPVAAATDTAVETVTDNLQMSLF